MSVLALDTAFDACSVALARPAAGSSAVIAARFERMSTGQAERLVPMIAEVLDEAGLAVADLASIVVANGPGTFTGTRIAVAAARALALAAGTPILALSSLHLMARQAALALRPDTEIAVVVDGRRDEVYVQRFDASGLVPRSAPGLLPVVTATQATAGALCVGSGSALVAPLSGGPLLADLVPDARFAADLLAYAAPAPHVAPLYLRAPDAKPSRAAPLLRQ